MMKANANFNTSLFRRFDHSTTAIASGIMICHPVKVAGTYHGTVLQEGKEAGSFTLVCTDASSNVQADVDLSKINNSIKAGCDCSDVETFEVRPEGYAIFYSSFGEGRYEVVLTSQEKNQPVRYSTRKLEKGDMAVVIFMRPGDYEVNGSNQQKCIVSVDMPNVEEYPKIVTETVHLTLDPTGFSNKEVKIAPGQGMVVGLETEGSIDIKLSKARDVDEGAKERKHNWENPKYKY